jgi:hypothetical protein
MEGTKIVKTVPVLTPENFVDDALKNVFIPTWENRPPYVPAVLSLNGVPVLSYQNISSVIARPGYGKSSLIEAVGAAYLNPECECLGWHVPPTVGGVIIIDTERTDLDVHNSFGRMHKRAGIPDGNVTIAGMRGVTRFEGRRKAIEALLQDRPCGLLLIDGAADLTDTLNDEPQSIECYAWLKELTVRYGVSIFCSLHPNPKDNKPRGHLGSELWRRSECVMVIKKEGDAKILTTDVDFGKQRNQPNVSVAFRWSDEKGMHVRVDLETAVREKKEAKEETKRNELSELARLCMPPPQSLNHGGLSMAVMEFSGLSEPTAKRRIVEMVKMGIIEKQADGRYRIRTV